MAASMWEVTQLILGAPGADAAEIAQAHGFSAAEVADLLPLVLDNVTLDWAGSSDVPGSAPPVAAPGEGVEELAARWLGELGAQLQGQAGVIDVVSYDSFGGSGFDLDGFDPGFEPGFDDLHAAAPASAPETGFEPADPVATFGRGDDASADAADPSDGGSTEPAAPAAGSTADLDEDGLYDPAVADLPVGVGDLPAAPDEFADLSDGDVDFG